MTQGGVEHKEGHLQAQLPMKLLGQNLEQHNDAGNQKGETDDEEPKLPDSGIPPAGSEVRSRGLHTHNNSPHAQTMQQAQEATSCLRDSKVARGRIS